MSLSIPALQALRSVAETGSFAGAARQLGLTAPGISQHIHGLEKTYGVQLFIRKNGQLMATPLSERVCASADRVLLEQAALERMLRHHGSLRNGELSVGLGNAMPGMSLIAAFNKSFPDVRLRITTGSFQKVMRAVGSTRRSMSGSCPMFPKTTGSGARCFWSITWSRLPRPIADWLRTPRPPQRS